MVFAVSLLEHLLETVDHERQQVRTSDALAQEVLAKLHHAVTAVQTALLQNSATMQQSHVLYAKIEVKSVKINIFTTHLQSKHPTNSKQKYIDYRLTRRSQIREINNFMKEKVREDEYYIITGDLNIDGREELKPAPFPVGII